MNPVATMDDGGALAALERAADELFYRHGVGAVSMSQIRDASGVSLRRLYSLCPSKSDLVSIWLRHRHRTWMAGFRAGVETGLANGIDPIDAVFDALSAWVTETGFRGCGFVNTFGESAERTDEHVEIIRSHKRSLAAYLKTLTQSGDAVAVLVDGAIVQSSIFGTVEPIALAQQAARALVAQDRNR